VHAHDSRVDAPVDHPVLRMRSTISAPLDLTGCGRPRKLLHELDPPGLLERSEFPLAVRAQRLYVELVGMSGSRHHDRTHDLTPLHVGNSDDCDVDDRGMVS
jgi:hypothetical protein